MREEISYNNRYLMKDKKPWFPVMGELHYSRYNADLWEESLQKMKAGGVSIVSCYAIWIHHEEEEGVFDFHGCRDLRRFVELCQKTGLYSFLRIGPWSHGEVRNGGFPDWVVEMEKEGVCLRSNDERYIARVERYWQQLFSQVKGLMYEDGGPIIGIQIENEYAIKDHPWAEVGEAHMRRLTVLAKEIGFRAPLNTATGWGNACIGDLLPVFGGYCDAPWDSRTTQLEPNDNFVFNDVRNDALIASDHHLEDGFSFDSSRYPYLTAELGGGIQPTSHRRPVSTGKDVGAMSTVGLGSGMALLGYYMYHGGSNPKGKLSTLQESRVTGYPNDLPEINYDFNAPLGQYGTISDSYREIRLLACFLKDFGEDFSPLATTFLPENVNPGDFETLRTCCRHDDTHGYVFFNNYQRLHTMKQHEKVSLKGLCAEGTISFPEMSIEDGDYGFFPYRMKLGDAVLRYALAAPLCRLETYKGIFWVFYGSRDPQFCWEGGKRADILHLTREDALRSNKIRLKKNKIRLDKKENADMSDEYLILTDGFAWEEKGQIRITGGSETIIRCFPEMTENVLPGFEKCGQDGVFTVYRRMIEETSTQAEIKTISKDIEKAVYEIYVTYAPGIRNGIESLSNKDAMSLRRVGRDVLLWLRYAGERMALYLNGEKINDHFYTGQDVPISLGYFHFPEILRLEVEPLEKDAPIYLEKHPDYVNGVACELVSVSAEDVYR